MSAEFSEFYWVDVLGELLSLILLEKSIMIISYILGMDAFNWVIPQNIHTMPQMASLF